VATGSKSGTPGRPRTEVPCGPLPYSVTPYAVS
jgi:hypothetical protein